VDASKIRGLFWKSAEGEQSDAPTESAGEAPAAALPRPATRAPSASLAGLRPGPSTTLFERTIGRTGVANASSHSEPVDQEFDTVIMGALEQESKEPGYKEFMAQFTALSGIITDKEKCTAAALATVGAAHPKLDAKQIAKSIGERMVLLGNFLASYDDECAKNQEGETREKGGIIGESRDRIKELEADLARISAEKASLEATVGRLQSDLAGVAEKYDGYRARFHATVNARREEFKRLMNFVAPGAK
jgi:hypothetical protein